MATTDQPKPFKWVGGNLALDFTNTVDWDGDEPVAGDLLPTFPRLVAWGREAGLLTKSEAAPLEVPSDSAGPTADATLQRAWELRRTIHGLFAAVAHGGSPSAAPLRSLNRLLGETPAQLAVASPGPTFAWVWPDADAPDRMLWPVAWAAAQLLTSPQLASVSLCANDRCGWLFVDTSRRHNRKWCEMGVCGNRAKARRFQERQRRRTGGIA